jgi:hypothetical protein
MKKNNINFCLILILALTIKRSLSTPNCLELMATSYFGFFNSCFIHAIESLKELIVFYSSTSVTGISFGLINDHNFSYMTNMGFTKSESINLTNSYLTGVEVWTGDFGIGGLKFQIYSPATSKFNFTSLLGSTNGCYSYLNSTFMQSNFFKINSIGGCVDNFVQNEFPSLNFHYSFSQCSLYSQKEISTSSSTSTITETSTSSTTATTTDTSTSSITTTTPAAITSSTTTTTTETSITSHTYNHKITTSTTKKITTRGIALTSQSNRQNIFTDDSCGMKSKFISIYFLFFIFYFNFFNSCRPKFY